MGDNEVEEKPVVVNKWDQSAVKNALDDAVKKVLKDKFGWREKHTMSDCRLFVSLIAVAFAGFALIWDYLRPFPESRPLYMWVVEGNTFFQAVDEDPTGKIQDRNWIWSSEMKKYDERYTVEARFRQGTSSGQGTLSKSVGTWVDEDGEVLVDKLGGDVVKLCETLLGKKRG